MKTKGIIFDKDGTLLDFDGFWTPVAEYAVEDILQKNQMEKSLKNQVLNAIGVKDGITDVDGVLCKGTYLQISQIIFGVLSKYKEELKLEDVAEISLKAFHDNIGKGEMKGTCENIAGVISNLKEKGIKLAVVTADDTFTTKKCLTALGIDDMFDVIYTDDGTHPNKPDPYCIEDFCVKFGLNKEQVVMVGDSLTDVNFAKNGCIKFVGVAKGQLNTAFLSAYADTVLPDVSHLSSVLE